MITCGFFGKLPAMGDFVSRGWLTSSRDGLDKLLQEAIVALLASSPSGQDTITQAPAVVLSIRPGVVGDQGVLAVVMPSQDRVGRIFPFSAGVQWTDDGMGGMGWPSIDYARVVIACVLRCVESEGEPEALLSDIDALGSPRAFAPTFLGLGGDETLPRLSPDTKLLRVQGPVVAMPPALIGLCAMLGGASDLLGVRLDGRGEVQDLFVCRRYESGAPLAAMFDGQWVERSWASYELPVVASNQNDIPSFDDDATRPRHRTIDTGGSRPDSPIDR